MGMCAIRGPRVLHEDDEIELSDQKSTTSSNSSGYVSAVSQELDVTEAASHFYQEVAIWQRTIPKGRRCTPLSFSGVIVYDEHGTQLKLPQEDYDDKVDEHFGRSRKNLAEREEAFQI
uniref:Uncharacterized protein n=1 Tax=Physcomitrium patens TaxID=3218 RepID=A9SPG1_PHYPA|nr:hypothetical protein PHYPA_029339 [Physcomitrium patens]